MFCPFICSQFLSSETRNVVYGFLMWRYLIKIPVHLPRLRLMSHTGPLWWHHIVVEAFPLGRLADLCLSDGTPSLHPHAAHILANSYLLAFHWEFFRKGLWSVHSCSLNTLTLFSCLLCVSHGRPRVAVTFWTVHVRDFGATCNFLLWDTNTSCIFPIFLPCTSSLLACLNPDWSLLKV